MSLFLASLFPLLASQALAQTEPNPTPPCEDPSATCETYGVDFQNGGNYFQNINSADDFTFVSQYSGCANDVAQNILVDPSGKQYTCSNTTLTPDFTNEVSTCNEAKSSLYSGEWNLIIISNNGGCAPLNAVRSFSITAGAQSTVTYTPTVTVTTTSTPVITSTTTDTFTATFTAPSSSGSDPPPCHTVTRTHPTQTITRSHLSIPSHHVITSTASCVIPSRAPFADPVNHIVPTVLPQAIQAIVKDVLPRDAALAPTTPARLAAREARANRKAKRAPDSATITVTDTNTADFSTTTDVVTAPPATTFTAVSTAVTVTVSPTPSAAASSVQASTTSVKTEFPLVTETSTWTTVPSVTVGWAPAGARQSCIARGGLLSQ